MTPIEKINWDKQTTSKALTIVTLKAELEQTKKRAEYADARLDGVKAKLTEAEKVIEEVRAERDRVSAWFGAARAAEGENKTLSKRIDSLEALAGVRLEQIDRLLARQQKSHVKAHDQALEIKRLKHRVNELIRSRKARRLAA